MHVVLGRAPQVPCVGVGVRACPQRRTVYYRRVPLVCRASAESEQPVPDAPRETTTSSGARITTDGSRQRPDVPKGMRVRASSVSDPAPP